MGNRVNSNGNISLYFVPNYHCTYFCCDGGGGAGSNDKGNKNRAELPHDKQYKKVVFKGILTKGRKKGVCNHKNRRADSGGKKAADRKGFYIGKKQLHGKNFSGCFSAFGKKKGGGYQLSEITDHI